ncbi:MAG: hypothetical protein LCH60_03530 [Actinobacteria bacterium]|nr:hypothetical protein [Actinomycetota bacterium]
MSATDCATGVGPRQAQPYAASYLSVRPTSIASSVLALLTCSVAALVAVAPSATAVATNPYPVVTLGDSYSSGTGLWKDDWQ